MPGYKVPQIKVVYEDEWLLVVDKPAGIPTISTGRGDTELTLYKLVMDYVSRGKKGARAWIVHRLDKGTSGLLLFAKDEATKRMLQDNWNEAIEERKYVALVEGGFDPEEGTIESYLWEEPKSHNVYPLEKPRSGAKWAVTGYKTLKVRVGDSAEAAQARKADVRGVRSAGSAQQRGAGSIGGAAGSAGLLFYSLVEFSLDTGRKNQIRVHSAWCDAPIAGDRKYGARTNPFGRLCLHARTLAFHHPHTGRLLKFTSPLPQFAK